MFKFIKNLKKRISNLWNGRVYGARPGEDAPYIGFIYYKSAIRARKIAKFPKKEYRFTVRTLLTVASILMAIVLS
jgi:serine/threonine-protein kinase RIO1